MSTRNHETRRTTRAGLDIYKHGEAAYPLGAYGHGWSGGLDETGQDSDATSLAVVVVEQSSLAGYENTEVHAMHKRSAMHTKRNLNDARDPNSNIVASVHM